jgi:hypothetical protein
MKKAFTTILAAFLLAWPAYAAGPAALEVSVDDFTAAGVVDVTSVSPLDDRFMAPVHYFRTSEKLSQADAKDDCADCADLIAIYAAEVPAVPIWADIPQQQFLKVGGRLQLKAYIASKRRVVTVTAPSEIVVRKISQYLVGKFSK